MVASKFPDSRLIRALIAPLHGGYHIIPPTRPIESAMRRINHMSMYRRAIGAQPCLGLFAHSHFYIGSSGVRDSPKTFRKRTSSISRAYPLALFNGADNGFSKPYVFGGRELAPILEEFLIGIGASTFTHVNLLRHCSHWCLFSRGGGSGFSYWSP